MSPRSEYSIRRIRINYVGYFTFSQVLFLRWRSFVVELYNKRDSSDSENLAFLMNSPSPPKKRNIGGNKVRGAFFVVSTTEPDVWVCKCGTIRKQTGTGYTNLVSQVKSEQFQDYQNLVSELISSSEDGSRNLSAPTFFCRLKPVQYHGWNDLVINGLHPFSVVDSEIYRRNIKHCVVNDQRWSQNSSTAHKETL